MPADLTRDLIANRSFRFERGAGLLENPAILLRDDGRIEGGQYPEEATWAIETEGSGPILNFHAADGRLAASFDRVFLDAGGQLALEGKHMLSPDRARRWLICVAPPPGRMWPPLPAPGPRADAERPLAVFVRSHRCDEKYHALMRKLDRNREGYDLFGLIDETHGRNDPGPWPVVWHSLQRLSQMGLRQRHPTLLHQCGDLALYVAISERPCYRRYLMLDDDVELRSDDAAAMNELVHALADRPELDFVGLFLMPDPGGAWGPTTAQVYGPENAWLARFPMVAVSRRLGGFLYSQRLLETHRDPHSPAPMNCEVFAASAAMAAGFSCADFNEVAPGSYDQTMMMLMYEPTGFGLPMGATFYGEAAPRFHHPVYTPSAWIERTRHGLMQAHPRAEQVLFNLARRLRQARARADAAMASAIEDLARELPPQMAEALSGAVRHIRLGAPASGESETWGEIEPSPRGPWRRLLADAAQWTRPTGADSGTAYLYVPVDRDRITDPEGVWALEMEGELTPLQWNWPDSQLYAVKRAPFGAASPIRLVKIAPREGALAVLCGDNDE